MKINFKKNKKQIKNNFLILPFSIVALFMTLASVNATAGAWVGAKGDGYTKLGYADFNSDTYRGDDPSFESFKGQNTSLYIDQGIGNNFALYGSLLYQSYTQKDAIAGENSASGFSDTEIGLRYQWQADPFVLSTSFLVKTPFLYDKEDGLGNDQEDYEIKVLLGKGLDEYGYVGAEFGYRLRTGEPSDEYRYLFEYGFNINENIYFRTKLDGILSAKNSDLINTVNSINLSNPLEFDVGKLELTTGWNFDKNSSLKGFGLELTYTRELYGKNVLEGNSFQLAITKVY